MVKLLKKNLKKFSGGGMLMQNGVIAINLSRS